MNHVSVGMLTALSGIREQGERMAVTGPGTTYHRGSDGPGSCNGPQAQ